MTHPSHRHLRVRRWRHLNDVKLKIIFTEKLYLMLHHYRRCYHTGCNEDSDQHSKQLSLIGVSTVRKMKTWDICYMYPLSTQWRLRSVWVDAQADLRLRWTQYHFVGLVMSWLKILRVLLEIIFIIKLANHFKNVEYYVLPSVQNVRFGVRPSVIVSVCPSFPLSILGICRPIFFKFCRRVDIWKG